MMNKLMLTDEASEIFSDHFEQVDDYASPAVPAVIEKSIPDLSMGLDLYKNKVRTIPFLTLEEEQKLAKAWSEKQDINAAWTMAYHHLRLVVATSRIFSGYGLNQEDLIQEGNIGLLKAVKKFDYTKGVRLSSWALHWIRAEMQNYIINNWRMIKMGSTKSRRKIFFNLRRLRKGTGHLSEDEVMMISSELNVPVYDVRDMATRMLPDIELDTPIYDYKANGTLLDTLAAPDKNIDSFSEMAESGILDESLQSLDAREKDIVVSRWLNTDNHVTLHDLGAKYGISAERVRQIEVGAMKKMKKIICAAA
jgi:RNA polymerase sigma-32 factor